MRPALLRAAPAQPPRYERRRPEQTTLYRLVQQHVETFAAEVAGLPQFTYMARTDSIDPDDVLMPLQAASSTYRIALGPRAGRKVRRRVRRVFCAVTRRNGCARSRDGGLRLR